MNIFFASDDKFAKYLCVALTSLLINADKKDVFNFYILDSGISEKSKLNILKLRKIKDFEIEYIRTDENIFKNLPLSSACPHIPLQTYFRYLIPYFKPDIEKCFYFDCDIIVKGSLQKLWNLSLEDNYAAVVEELYKESPADAARFNLKHSFNAGVLLINNKKWVEDNIMEKLFSNTLYLAENNLLRWNDQDVLNYTFREKVIYVSPKYNLQQNAYFDGQHSCYTEEEMDIARQNPVIIHYNGYQKPWHNGCQHKLEKEYFRYLRKSPYKKEYWCSVVHNFVRNIFSVRNSDNHTHKIIIIMGLKISVKKACISKRKRVAKNGY